MPYVHLGNPSPLHSLRGEVTPLDFEGDEIVTESWQPPSYTIAESVHNLAHPVEGQWGSHSAARRPSWVWSDSRELAEALAAEFGCPVSDEPGTVTR
jgi:hypothetical protein